MEITPQEIYCAINSLKAREEWIMDDGYSADEELPHIKSLLKKRSEEHTSELQSHSFISYAVFCLKKKKISKMKKSITTLDHIASHPHYR